MNASAALPASMLSGSCLQYLDGHVRSFAAHAAAFHTGDPDHDSRLDLKAEHSMRVLARARDLAQGEAALARSPLRRRALLLAALYHDLGRFPQYRQYGTFSDARSVNHARLGVVELKRAGLLDGEEPAARRLALAAIILHNRFSLPARLDEDTRAVAQAVRDADKLDIMRIMAGQLTGEGPVDPVVALHAEPSPQASPAVLAAVMERRLGAYADIRTTTDFKLLVCGWLYDLRYPLARRMAAADGHLAALAASLPATEQLAVFLARYRDDLAAYGPA